VTLVALLLLKITDELPSSCTPLKSLKSAMSWRIVSHPLNLQNHPRVTHLLPNHLPLLAEISKSTQISHVESHYTTQHIPFCAKRKKSCYIASMKRKTRDSL